MKNNYKQYCIKATTAHSSHHPFLSRLFKCLPMQHMQVICLVAGLLIFNTGWGQTTLANYSFEGSGLSGSTNVTSTSGVNPSLTASATVTYNAGSTTSSTASACFASANGKYFELTLTTTGYSNITVDWNARTSSTTSSWAVTADDGSGYGSTLATQSLS
ncbi:MAG: hypothetical protein ACK574_07795, partial [Bacteroidota bacterium]